MPDFIADRQAGEAMEYGRCEYFRRPRLKALRTRLIVRFRTQPSETDSSAAGPGRADRVMAPER
jgi:hypothetical protein